MKKLAQLWGDLEEGISDVTLDVLKKHNQNNSKKSSGQPKGQSVKGDNLKRDKTKRETST